MLTSATENKILPRIILGLTALATLLLVVHAWLVPPAVFPDPSWGFQVLRGMQQGGHFNMLTQPNHDDIAQNTSSFLTWWSPGQYLVPYLFKAAFSLNYGQAAVLTSLMCELLGLAGFYTFLKKAGFSPIISAVSIALMASQQFFFIPYVFYNGGEVLLFAFAGWFLYGCFAVKQPGWRLCIFVLLAGWIGFICKSSFMWAYAAGLCCLWLNLSLPERKLSQWVKNGFWIGIPAVLSVACIYLFYLSKGDNPASAGKSMRLLWETLSFPLASPLLSGFSLDDVTNGLIYHPDGPMFSYFWTIVILLACAALSIVLLIGILRSRLSQTYQITSTVFYVVAVLFFGYAFLKQMAISYEGRHFRLVGLIFIPGAVYLISRIPIAFRLVFGLVWIGIAWLSFGYLVKGKTINLEDGVRGPSGLTQQFIDQPSLDYITQLDRQHHNAVFVFISADLALEINHNRVITLQPVGPDIKLNYEDYVFDGHAGPLYILLPSDYATNSKAAILTKCFPGYHNFKMKELSEDYVLYESE